jgi:hypothetical protein
MRAAAKVKVEMRNCEWVLSRSRAAGFAGAAVTVLLLWVRAQVTEPGGLRGARGVDRQAALGVRAHLVEGWLVRAADLLAIGAGLGAGVDVGRAGGDGAVGVRAHVLERGFAGAGAGHGRGLGKGGLHRLIVAGDAGG